MWHFGMTVNILLKFSSLKPRSIHCHSLYNLTLVNLCGKALLGHLVKDVLNMCPFLLDSRLAEYAPVHSHPHTQVCPCGRVCDVYWPTLQRNLADHGPKVGASDFHWALNTMDNQGLNRCCVYSGHTLFLPQQVPF